MVLETDSVIDPTVSLVPSSTDQSQVVLLGDPIAPVGIPSGGLQTTVVANANQVITTSVAVNPTTGTLTVTTSF